MSIDSLILDTLDKYISYFYEKNSFLTSKQVYIVHLKINNIEYMANCYKLSSCGTFKFYKIYDPITGAFIGIYNDETNNIQYNNETVNIQYDNERIDIHSNINRYGLDMYNIIYEFSNCNVDFIAGKLRDYSRYWYRHRDDIKEHIILNKIIAETIEDNEDNHDELYFRLFYYSKYKLCYHQVGAPIEEKINNQEYENFKNTSHFNRLHGESKNIALVMEYIASRIDDIYFRECINEVIHYRIYSIYTLR